MSGTPKDQKRSSVQRASKIQQQKLLEIMEQNPEVARGTAKNCQTSFWDDLAIQLNALGPPSKSGKEWLRAWIEKKYNTKRKITENKKQQNMTGGGVGNFQKIDDLDERVMAISNLDKSVAPAPDSICIGVPEELQEVEPLPLQQKAGTSRSVDKCSTDIYEPAKKRTAMDISFNQEDSSSELEEPITIHKDTETSKNTAQTKTSKKGAQATKDFTQIVIEQNDKIIENLQGLNELARTFVTGTLQFQQEILAHLKKENSDS